MRNPHPSGVIPIDTIIGRNRHLRGFPARKKSVYGCAWLDTRRLHTCARLQPITLHAYARLSLTLVHGYNHGTGHRLWSATAMESLSKVTVS